MKQEIKHLERWITGNPLDGVFFVVCELCAKDSKWRELDYYGETAEEGRNNCETCGVVFDPILEIENLQESAKKYFAALRAGELETAKQIAQAMEYATHLFSQQWCQAEYKNRTRY